MRIEIVDGLRGYFLIMMMMVHLENVSPFLSKLNHHKLGYVEDAQGFVFLSGFVLCVVYGKVLKNTSFKEVSARLYQRVKLIYLYNLLSLFLVFFLAYGGFAFSEKIKMFAGLGDNIIKDAAISALVINGPRYVDILPMYIIFMIFTPYIIWLLQNGRVSYVVATSAFLWLVAQSRFISDFLNYIFTASGLLNSRGLDLMLYFDRWAWQVLFVSGIVTGHFFMSGQLPLHNFKKKIFEDIFFICLVFLAALFSLRVIYFLGILETSSSVKFLLDRSHFGILRVVNFVAIAYAFTYLVTAGGSSRFKWIRVLGNALRSVFCWGPLVFLGKHSLQAYALHVVLVYILAAATFQFNIEIGYGYGDAILILCWAILFIPGLWKMKVYMKGRSSKEA